MLEAGVWDFQILHHVRIVELNVIGRTGFKEFLLDGQPRGLFNPNLDFADLCADFVGLRCELQLHGFFAIQILFTVARDQYVRPNTGWLPAELLDENGFVRVTPELRVPGHPGVFAVGDVAATDPLRSSARNRADGLLAHNVRAEFAGRRLRSYRPPKRRWGSVIGIQPDGLEVFAPNGRAFTFPAWSFDRVLMPLIVRWGIYRGVRDNKPSL